MRALAFIVAAAATFAAPAAAQSRLPVAIGSEVGTLTLTDQHGHGWTVSTADENPVVIILASPDETRDADEWAKQVKLTGTKARVYRVLDVSKQSEPWKASLRKSLRNESPVAVDWDGSVAKLLGHVDGKAIVVVAQKGRVTAVVDGPVESPQFAAVLTGLRLQV